MRALGLRARLVLLVLVALAPVFGLVAWAALQSQREALDSARARLLSQAQLAAAAQERLFDKTRSLVEAVGHAPAIRDASPSACTGYFKSLLIQYPMYTAMGLVSPDAILICNAQDARRPLPPAARAQLEALITANRFMMGQYQRSPTTGAQFVLFAAPVSDMSGQLQNAAYAALGLSAMSNALISIPRVDGGETWVMDRTGVVLATYPPKPGMVGMKAPSEFVQQAIRDKRSGLAQSMSEGRHDEWAFARTQDLGQTNVFVAVNVPREAIVAPVRVQFATQLAVLLLTALAGGLIAWLMGERMMVEPARLMLEKANAVARGDLASRVVLNPTHRRSELSQLGEAFNHMARALQTRRAELDDMLRSVEKEHALLDLIINNMSEGVVAADTHGRLLLFNAAARRLFGHPASDAAPDAWTLGHGLMDPLTRQVIDESERPLARAVRGEHLDGCEFSRREEGNPDRVLSMNIRPLLDIEGQLIGGLVVVTDVSERRASEDFARGQEQILELVAAGVPLGMSLDAVARLIERREPDCRCSILLKQGDFLRQGAAPSLPPDFTRAINGLPVAEGSAVCGTAAWRREAVFVPDVMADPLAAAWRDLAQQHHISACWSTPVLNADGDVLATFAIYRQQPSSPTPHELSLVDVATRLVRLAIERSRSEEALRDSETRFRELAENIQDVFYSLDPHSGRIVYVSPAYETLWGRSCESLIEDPDSFTRTIHPDDREQAVAMRAQGAGRMSDLQYRVLRPDGSVRWVHDHSYPVVNASGVVERVVGTARDITPRKQADLDLLHTNRALQMLSRGNEALVRAEDEQQLLLEICRLAVNVGGYQMAWVGYAMEDIERTIEPRAWAGQELGYLSEVTLRWSEDDPRGQGPAGRTIRSGHVVVCEDVMAESSGFFWRAQAFSRGYRSLICLPLHDNRRTFGMLALFSPTVLKTRWEEVKLLQELVANLAYGISSLRARAEQRRIEQAMRDANERLVEQASLLDRAQDAIVVRDVDPPVIRYWNKGAERLYGWSATEVIGHAIQDRMYADPAQFDMVMRELKSHGEWTGELDQRDRHGTPLAIEGRWTLVRDERGEPSSVLAINTDIRERKRARDQILRLNVELEHRVQQRTGQLLAANKELEAFSYSVSHDLRTPLNAIDGFSHLLERSMVATAEDRQKHFLTRIRTGVRQMGELIEGLLLLSQISRANLRSETVDLASMAHQGVAMLREGDPTRTVTVVVQDQLSAQGDSRLLRQVVENLITNAWKFTAHAGEAHIEVASQHGQDGETIYFVRDNGAGFDMAHAGKLFGAFQRLHAATEFPGTGIGLATVARIIKRHGGRIWAESSPGMGATFYFTVNQQDSLPE